MTLEFWQALQDVNLAFAYDVIPKRSVCMVYLCITVSSTFTPWTTQNVGRKINLDIPYIEYFRLLFCFLLRLAGSTPYIYNIYIYTAIGPYVVYRFRSRSPKITTSSLQSCQTASIFQPFRSGRYAFPTIYWCPSAGFPWCGGRFGTRFLVQNHGVTWWVPKFVEVLGGFKVCQTIVFVYINVFHYSGGWFIVLSRFFWCILEEGLHFWL